MTADESNHGQLSRRPALWWLLGLGLAAVLCVDIICARLLFGLAILDILGASLAVIGVYSLILGASASVGTPVMAMGDLVSRNLAEYLSGNFLLLATISAFLGNAVDPRRARPLSQSRVLRLLDAFIIRVICWPLTFGYFALHILVVVPLAYVAVAPAALIVDSALGSSRPLSIKVTDNRTGQTHKWDENWLTANRVSVTGFVVALPTSVAAILVAAFAR